MAKFGNARGIKREADKPFPTGAGRSTGDDARAWNAGGAVETVCRA